MSSAPITSRRSAAVTAVAMSAALVLSVFPLAPAAQGQPGPAIAFVNPSRPPDLPIVSDRDAGGDGTYRLAAWFANPPPNPIVEFEVQVAATTVTLGPAQQVSADTWEFQWNISGIADGNYFIRAILFDGTTLQEVAQQELSIGLRHGQVDPAAAAARVEILSPANGGQAGFYRPPGANQPASTVIDFARTTNTTFVRPQYTLTSPGQTPEWRTCAEGNPSASAGRVRCTLAAADDPTQVTGLRLIANATVGPAASPAFDAAADGIRVEPYVQVPSSIRVTEPTTRGADMCSTTFTSTVTDQNGRPVAAANVDVHAVGPTNELRFDLGNTTHTFGPPSPNQAPDSGPHATEAGYDCFLLQLSDRLQGLHRRPGEPNVKHVESRVGTNNSGTFGFALHSADPGTAHVTLWVDLDGNDEWQPGEPCAVTAVGWGAEAPPVPESEFEGCAVGAPDGPPAETPARLTLQPAQHTAAEGSTVTLVATVRGETGTPVAGEPVSWETTGVGEIVFKDDVTDSAGRATAQVRSGEEGEQTVTASSARCTTPTACTDTSTVTWIPLSRHPRRITVNFRRPSAQTLAIRGRVFVRSGFQPCGRRVPVRVQRRRGGRWVTLRNTTTGGNRRYAVRVPFRRGAYRAIALRTIKGAHDQHVCRRALQVRRR